MVNGSPFSFIRENDLSPDCQHSGRPRQLSALPLKLRYSEAFKEQCWLIHGDWSWLWSLFQSSGQALLCFVPDEETIMLLVELSVQRCSVRGSVCGGKLVIPVLMKAEDRTLLI